VTPSRAGETVRRLAALLLSCALAGCAIEFGVGEDDRGVTATTARERNRLYLEEQERLERDRQTFQPIRASER
jgi:hypothetical protein